VIVTAIYPAGEDKLPGVDAEPLVEAIRAHGHRDVSYVADLDGVLARLLELGTPGDLLLTLGAGSITSLGARLVEALRERRA
jgi:UDP-N-acetylmuramate--alanine ligase